eukprot:365173-Chlamydomonas_euryale.AAC.9
MAWRSFTALNQHGPAWVLQHAAYLYKAVPINHITPYDMLAWRISRRRVARRVHRCTRRRACGVEVSGLEVRNEMCGDTLRRGRTQSMPAFHVARPPRGACTGCVAMHNFMHSPPPCSRMRRLLNVL